MSEKNFGSEILLTDSGMNSLIIKLVRIQETEKNLASKSKHYHNFSWIGFFKTRKEVVSQIQRKM